MKTPGKFTEDVHTRGVDTLYAYLDMGPIVKMSSNHADVAGMKESSEDVLIQKVDILYPHLDTGPVRRNSCVNRLNKADNEFERRSLEETLSLGQTAFLWRFNLWSSNLIFGPQI